MINQIRILSEKIVSLKETITTEEATKTSFVLPLLQILGYDIFNPKELLPECVSDIGSKKGEKVDYLLYKDNNPTLIIECKKWSEDLNLHVNQLVRYYHTSKVKFGLLTNGLEYHFFTDLDQPNIMDTLPFFSFNVLNFSDSDINNFIKFSKKLYDIDNIVLMAENLKYLSKCKNIILKELHSPSDEFIKLISKQIYSGRFTQKVNDKFKNLISTALTELFPPVISIEEEKSKVITTEEELALYNDILINLPEYKNILSYKDFKGHFSIILNNNTRQCVLKALFNTKKKYIMLIDGENELKLEYNPDLIINNLSIIKNRIEFLLN